MRGDFIAGNLIENHVIFVIKAKNDFTNVSNESRFVLFLENRAKQKFKVNFVQRRCFCIDAAF